MSGVRVSDGAPIEYDPNTLFFAGIVVGYTKQNAEQRFDSLLGVFRSVVPACSLLRPQKVWLWVQELY